MCFLTGSSPSPVSVQPTKSEPVSMPDTTGGLPATRPEVPVAQPADPMAAYIQQCRGAGMADADIRNVLAQSGYTPEMLDPYFR